MASAFQIEKGIPAPSRTKFPFDSMEVGDSFFIPGARSGAEVSSSTTYRKNRYGEGYVTRSVEGGVRVWRVA